ncbi:hypothetical protein ALC56_04431 [Trachymyrmex septentrionalis]|uniref:Uncharacterized protein n=1 Tax=Trachymyrmex septentrionalis TaxID=34720 RepID=A0A195FKT9_9HYME|nr:hypothetical protein ALC56_04431 [Trachymyrmex septentrionalis]
MRLVLDGRILPSATGATGAVRILDELCNTWAYLAHNHWIKKRRETCIKISCDSRYVRHIYVIDKSTFTLAAVSDSLSNPNKLFHVMDREDIVESITKESASATSIITIDFQHFMHADYLLPYFPQLLTALLFNAINLQPIFIGHSLDQVLIAQLIAQLASGVTSFQIGGQVIFQNFPQFCSCKCSLQRSSSSNHDLYHLAVHCTNQQNAGLILHCLSAHQIVDINIDAKSNIAQEFNTWIGCDFVKCIEDVLHILMIWSNPIAY